MDPDTPPEPNAERRRRDARRELEAMIDAAFSQSIVETGSRVCAAPARTILVDGFNVLHATLDAEARAAGWWRRVWREDLLRRVARWPEAADRIWVAFDGAEPAWSVWAEPVAKRVGPHAGPQVHSVYVESADDWIVRRARRATQPETTIVVSRDRQVAGRARSAGCEVWSPGALLERCPPVVAGEGGG